MTAAILDTNVVVQSTISSRRSASAQVIDAYYAGHFRLVFSPATADELLAVMTVPQIRARHGWDDAEILRFITSLLAGADIYTGGKSVSPALTRDATDAKFLALAEESSCGYLVTNDRRHLLRLGRHEGTRIVSPRQFLAEVT